MSDLRERIADASRVNLVDKRMRWPETHGEMADWVLSMSGIDVVDSADLQQLLAVAQLYVTAFDDDETMTLPEKLRLQEIERILGIGVADGG